MFQKVNQTFRSNKIIFNLNYHKNLIHSIIPLVIQHQSSGIEYRASNIRHLIIKFSISIIAALIISGCAAKEIIHYEIPPDWKTDEIRNQTISKYSEYLSGKKIFLDAGHGGTERKNKGKIITEADVNLKVALALREYLVKAGAIVFMSRDKDTTINLLDRPVMANNSGADIFISIHHNAPGSIDDNWTNYTSTYYHASEEYYEYEPSERDLAKFIQRDLSYVMDNPGGLGSFDGTYSDYIIYPKKGFAVLRLTQIPSILVECGFHTNPFQEKRLAINEFNKIQAWGIFRGLAKYFQNGIPQIIPMDTTELQQGDIVLKYILQDKAGIDPESISVYYDSLITHFTFDTKTNLLQIPIYQIPEGLHDIRIICANKNGNHTLPFHKKIFIKPASS